MLRPISLALAAATLLAASAPAYAAGEHRLGVGLQYWKSIDEVVDEGLPDDVDDDGVSGVVSWQYVADWLLRVEVDLELHPDGFAGSTDTTIAPNLYLLAGTGMFYAGVGAGVAISDGLEDEVSDPFWTGRIGLDLHPAPRLHVDIHANYRVDAFSELEDVGVDGDVWTLGAALRFTL